MKRKARQTALFLVTFVLIICWGGLVWAGGAGEGSPKAGEGLQKKLTLRMGLISAEGHPVTEASKKFAQAVKERTGGMIEIEVIPGGALGGEIEMQDMVSQGTLDLASFGNAIPINYNPSFQILQMPFVWDDQDQMIAFAEGDLQKEMNEVYRQKTGVRILASNWDQGARHLIAKRPIQKLEDLKGLKVRVPQNPAWVDVWQMLGCNVVMLPWPELYPALQQGVCDAAEPPLDWMFSGSLHEPAKHITLTGHIMYFNLVFINDKLYASLPPNVQKIMAEAAHEAGVYNTELVRNSEAALKKKLLAAGVTFYEIDRKKIAEVTSPVYAKWEKSFGNELRMKVEEFKRKYNQKKK